MTASDVVSSARKSLGRMGYLDAVEGKEIFNSFGNRVVEHVTATGKALAIKVKPPRAMDRSEGDMMHYAATHGVLAPRVRGVYDIVGAKGPLARVLVSEMVPGEPLADVWEDLDEAQKSDIKTQLREQIAAMHACTESFMGRVGRQHVRNVYDRLRVTYCGPFANEEEFDTWCLARLPIFFTGFRRWKWQRWLERCRRDTPTKFVLTHGDFSPRNIQMQDGKITGIIDWERGGFFPEYAEYAFAMTLCHEMEKWWIPVLKEILPQCSAKRLKLTRLVEDRGW